MRSNNYLFDNNLTRYQLVKSIPGKIAYNWLFFPGGPGIDSEYLLPLIDKLDIEGNCWLIDFLNNGNNVSNENKSDPKKICESWDSCFLSVVNKFENPIVVGHSFSGFYPLFFPALEKILKGFVILNSAPIPPRPLDIDTKHFEQHARENKLPFRDETISNFLSKPSISTIKEVYLSMVPYAFSAEYIAQGIKAVENFIANVDTSYWWLTEGSKKYTTIKWIPEKVPTLLLGGTHDFITPLSLFEQDLRFHRDNIEIMSIPNAGHFSWIEQGALINDAICSFKKRKLI